LEFPRTTETPSSAREHLHELAKLPEFMLGDHPYDWPAGRPAGSPSSTPATPAPCAPPPAPSPACSKAAELDNALGYFEHNAHCLHYARVKSLSMFTGSGGVEAGCKAIAGQRCKLSGMRLSQDGAADILTLRRMEASSRWEEIWIQPCQTPAA
jgi:hypothetical protein